MHHLNHSTPSEMGLGWEGSVCVCGKKGELIINPAHLHHLITSGMGLGMCGKKSDLITQPVIMTNKGICIN